MTTGEKIKMLRKKLGFTQDELALYAHTKKQTIHKYEVGIIQNIPASKIKLLAEKLNTTPAYLMGWDETSVIIDKSQLPDISSPSTVDPDAFAIKMYKTLDNDDKAEIRGEMKQMLKTDKYKEEKKLSNEYSEMAAFNGEITKNSKKKRETTL